MVSLPEAYARLVAYQGGRGSLITLEGIDGCGKSTQHDRLAARLKAEDLPVVVSREPTDGEQGRRIRELLSQPGAPDRAMAEQLRDLFLADRRDHVEGLVEPALATGKLVLLDRYYHSSIAYQGAAGLDPQQVRTANEAIAPVPDLTFILDLPVEVAAGRLGSRNIKDAREAGEDRTSVEDEILVEDDVMVEDEVLVEARQAGQVDGFEASRDYQERVRQQYLALASLPYVEIVDVTDDISTIEAAIWKELTNIFIVNTRR